MRERPVTKRNDLCSYVFLLFQQSREFANQTLVTSNTSIINFNISQFADEVNLGKPIGGTFILVGPETNSTETAEETTETETEETA